MSSVIERRRPPGDLELLVEVGILHKDLEHEAVLLRFGQRIGSFLFDRVLRRQHEKRIVQAMPHPADGGLTFLHGFEQGRLRLGRRTVDFVGEDHVGKQRAGEELELALAGAAVFLDDLGAGDVGRHQVRRELNTAERQGQALGEGADHQGLGQPRHAFEHAVPSAEQGDQQLLDDFVLSDDDPGQLLFDVLKAGLQAAHSFHIVVGQGFRCRIAFGMNQLRGERRFAHARVPKTGVRGQETGVRGQGSGVRGQETGVRGQETGVRGQETGARKQGSAVHFSG